MKWNLLFGTLVLSVGLCAQSQARRYSTGC